MIVNFSLHSLSPSACLEEPHEWVLSRDPISDDTVLIAQLHELFTAAIDELLWYAAVILDCPERFPRDSREVAIRSSRTFQCFLQPDNSFVSALAILSALPLSSITPRAITRNDSRQSTNFFPTP
jgi:hypothetical protein